MEILPPLSEEDRMLAGLGYPFWPVVPPLVLLSSRREEPFVHFHALQALALGLVSTGGGLLLALFTWLVLKVLPGSSPTFSGVVGLGVFAFGFFSVLFYFGFLFFTAWRAAAGRFLRLPFLGAWAEARMQARLGLTAEDYSVEPLPRVEPGPILESVPEEDLEGFQEAVQEVGVAELTRLHRPASRPGFPGRPTSRPEEPSVDEEPPAEAPGQFAPLPLGPGTAARRMPGAAPRAGEEPGGDDSFQPGLFPRPSRPGSRRFKWEPLDSADEEKDSGGDDGFRGW